MKVEFETIFPASGRRFRVGEDVEIKSALS